MSDLRPVDLQRIMAHGWQGRHVQWLGDWLLRAAGGFTGRANSALPLGPADVPDPVADVRAFYAREHLPPIVQTFPGCAGRPGDDLAVQLAADGWAVGDPVLVMTAAVPGLLGDLGEPVHPAAVLLESPDADWLRGYKYRGADLPPHALDVLTRAEVPVFAAVRDDHGQAGVARGVVHDGWLGVTAITVEPERRRRGVGAHLVTELARWAAPLGAADVYLQVDAANRGAVALYERLGFYTHHEYRYARA